MPDTKDGQKRIKSLEEGMADVKKSLTIIQADIKEIKDCLLGDAKYKTKGMIDEHKEMYDTYITSRDILPDAVNDYKGGRWFLQHVREFVVAVIGIFVALIAAIIVLLTEK